MRGEPIGGSRVPDPSPGLTASESNSHRDARRRIAVLLVCLGSTLALLGVAGCGGGGGKAPAGTDRASLARVYAQELTPNPVLKPVEGIDPDSEPESSADAWVVVSPLGKDRFRLTVTNISAVGFINNFKWAPPAGMTVTGVTRTSTGSCAVADSKIACTAVIKPPKCTCKPGGKMTVDFTAKTSAARNGKKYGVVSSYVEIDGMTPVPYRIPSFREAKPPEEDLPLCAPGAESTRDHPCTHPQ